PFSSSTGTVDGAQDFDGSDDYVNVSDKSSLRPNSGSWTVAAWVKPSDVNQFAPIIEKRQNSGSFEEFSMVIKDNDSHAATPGRRISCLLIENAGVTERSAYTTNNVVDRAWHHVECVRDSLADNYYIFAD